MATTPVVVPAPDHAQKTWRTFGADVAPKLFVTLVITGVTALLIPSITSKWQDHKQQLELRTSIATEMSNAYTNVIITGRFVTGGLIYSGSTSKAENTAYTQNAWTTALREWLVASGTLEAQLTGRYGSDGIARTWLDYANAVTRYMRIGSQVPAAEREKLLADERAYVGRAPVNWQPLHRVAQFKRDAGFRASYTELGAFLLGRGDAIVQEELTMSPRV